MRAAALTSVASAIVRGRAGACVAAGAAPIAAPAQQPVRQAPKHALS